MDNEMLLRIGPWQDDVEFCGLCAVTINYQNLQLDAVLPSVQNVVITLSEYQISCASSRSIMPMPITTYLTIKLYG